MNTLLGIQVLEGVVALYESKPNSWCRSVNAYNAKGQSVMAKAEDAVMWCKDGAIVKVAATFGDEVAANAARTLVCEFCNITGDMQSGIFGWNDNNLRTKAEVMESLRGAIALGYSKMSIDPVAAMLADANTLASRVNPGGSSGAKEPMLPLKELVEA